MVPPSKWLINHKKSFIANQRGAVAFETLIVISFLIFFLLLPLADLAVAGFKYISAHQALRDMAQRTEYSPPADVTNAASITAWQSSLPTTVAGYTVTAQIYCSGTPAPCASDPPSPAPPSPKYYTFSTSFTLSPMSPMLRALQKASRLCSTCSVIYSQPFQ